MGGVGSPFSRAFSVNSQTHPLPPSLGSTGEVSRVMGVKKGDRSGERNSCGGDTHETEAPWQESSQLVQGRSSTPVGVVASEVCRRQDPKGVLSLKVEHP